MTNKDKYTRLMQRYWDAETTPEEERELALYAARTDDPAFTELRAMLGYLSIGKEKKVRKSRAVWMYSFAAFASCIVAVAVIGLNPRNEKNVSKEDSYVRYAYGEVSSDKAEIMATVDASLADFFGEHTPAETNLIEMFKR
jgi:hypothetical protein